MTELRAGSEATNNMKMIKLLDKITFYKEKELMK